MSSHEVAQGYKTVKERSAIVRFKIVDEDAYFLAWTTTPWTLPSNVALCLNPDSEYAKVKAADGYTYYMAVALLDTVLGKLATEETKAYEILETYKGTDLKGKAYEPLFECSGVEAANQKKKAHYAVCDNYVTMEDGTGIVHIAPAFGEDDARVGRDNDLPMIQFVDTRGNMTEQTPFAGLFVKDADPEVLKDLEARGQLFSAPKFEHEYPFCWRCDTPLIYFARSTWFIAMSKKRDELLASNNMVNWYPESIRDGRMGDFLRNVIDWGISRERYWGTPLPVWECECGYRHCIGSIEELKSMSDDCPDDIELHKPYVDNVHIKCPECGGKMTRVPEVIDCWFDSGSMPFAQYHYPFENKEFFESHYPCDFISEALDQTRGWFYSLLAISTVLFGRSPFKNCIVMGLVQDENGKKMSKHLGNVVDPWDILNKQGADAARWYFYSANQPWLPSRFSDNAVNEGIRKFIGTYWNTYSFYVMYADIDNFDPNKYTLDTANLNVMDKWVLSKLNSLVADVNAKMDAYDISAAARMIQDFTDELSNWYVRLNRDRFWAGEMNKDKIDAFMTLYTALETLTRLAAPFVPFVTEQVYQNIVRSVNADAPESVHLCEYPVADTSLINKEIEKEMALAAKVVELGRAARNASSMKNRQPLSEIYVVADYELTDEYKNIVLNELNIRSYKAVKDASALMDFSFKPQLRTCGRKFGKLLNAAKDVIAALPGKETMKALEEGPVTITVEGENFEMTKDDFIVETVQPEGLSTQEDGGITASINTVLTEDLIIDGFVREMISKIQTQRKEAGLEVVDRIILTYEGNEKLASIIAQKKDFIASEVLATDIVEGKDGFTKEWDVNGEKITFGVKKA